MLRVKSKFYTRSGAFRSRYSLLNCTGNLAYRTVNQRRRCGSRSICKNQSLPPVYGRGYRRYRRGRKNIANNLDVIFNRHKKPIWDTMDVYRWEEDHLPFDIRRGRFYLARSAIGGLIKNEIAAARFQGGRLDRASYLICNSRFLGSFWDSRRCEAPRAKEVHDFAEL